MVDLSIDMLVYQRVQKTMENHHFLWVNPYKITILSNILWEIWKKMVV